MKKFFSLVLASLCAISMVACGAKEEIKDATATEIADKIKANFDTMTDFVEVNDSTINNLYLSLDTGKVAEYKVYTSSAFTAEEIAVFKVNDVNDITNINEALQERKEAILDNFADYNPEQYEIAKENTKIITKGNFALLVVGSEKNVNKATDNFIAMLK